MSSETQDPWQPIEIDQLRIGHYIKINHRWFDHPFVRRMFQISSDREIQTIREVELTRIFVDEKRSAADSAKAEEANPAPGGAEAVAEEPSPEQKKAEEAAAIKAEREALAAAQLRGRVTLERAQYVLSALNYADNHGATVVDEFVDYLVAMLNNSTTPLALMASSLQGHSAQRQALLGADAVSMAAVIGKRMGLKKPELRTLTRAAATHLLGLARLPPNQVDEEADGAVAKTANYRNYPLFSVAMLEKCGGFSDDVLRIVREHRERPDGRGFPQGLKAEAIHPQALIVGAVREFQVRCAGGKSPVPALAYLNKNLRAVFGAEIIGHLAASLLSYPAGTHVQLSDGRVARVLRSEEAMRLSPIVEVFEDTSNLRNRERIDLSQQKGLSIVRVLDTSRLPPRMFETAKRSMSGEPPKPEAATGPDQAAEAATPPAEGPAAAPAPAPEKSAG
jgi:HD-GYP domain-containing protein (c-di-GMP phosphodiesterase class II)